MTTILFTSDDGKVVNPDFAIEYEVARATGFDVALVNSFELETNAPRSIRVELDGTVVYRGWMLTYDVYQKLHEVVKMRGGHLINDPTEYLACHYLPNYYPYVSGASPTTVWTPDMDLSIVKVFGDKPIIVKDYVKSQKHYRDAFYIERASDAAEVKRVVDNFVKMQGTVSGGLVFREFIELKGEEKRWFFVNADKNFEFGGMKNPPSNFFCVDIDYRSDDKQPVVVEMGDGQVSDIKGDVVDFYKKLKLGTNTGKLSVIKR